MMNLFRLCPSHQLKLLYSMYSKGSLVINLFISIFIFSLILDIHSFTSSFSLFFTYPFSPASYTESSSEDETGTSPRDKVQRTSKGFTDFCVKNISQAPYGRKEIEMAEQGLTSTFWHKIIINNRFRLFIPETNSPYLI